MPAAAVDDCLCCGQPLDYFPYVVRHPRIWCSTCSWHVSHDRTVPVERRTFESRTGVRCPMAPKVNA